MILELEPNEVQFILQVLGQLPTSSGVYPLLKKIEIQAKEPEPMVVGGAD
jgi:hypothetical protein